MKFVLCYAVHKQYSNMRIRLIFKKENYDQGSGIETMHSNLLLPLQTVIVTTDNYTKVFYTQIVKKKAH